MFRCARELAELAAKVREIRTEAWANGHSETSQALSSLDAALRSAAQVADQEEARATLAEAHEQGKCGHACGYCE